jgi:UDP-N-acetylglucosamine 1-carboxyvinyltransferase
MIRITGVKELHGCTYSIAPDMIEAGTYMVAAAAAGGRLEVKKIIPKHLDAITIKLREMGVSVETGDNCLTVVSDGKFRGTSIKTNPYPGFPTDMHPQFSAMLCLAEGMSSVSEGIWSGRFRYTEELKKMGAVIDVVDNVAHISGVSGLSGAEVKASDLRAGACLVIAGLSADGQTTISGIEYIDRGYQDFVDKLRAIGADITRI